MAGPWEAFPSLAWDRSWPCQAGCPLPGARPTAECPPLLLCQDIDIKKVNGVPQYAFLQYCDITSVCKAIKKMDGEYLGNNRLKVIMPFLPEVLPVGVDCHFGAQDSLHWLGVWKPE